MLISVHTIKINKKLFNNSKVKYLILRLKNYPMIKLKNIVNFLVHWIHYKNKIQVLNKLLIKL